MRQTMHFFRRAEGMPSRLGILPGTFNPITVAHVALARAALSRVDEVVYVLPRVFPHKPYGRATFAQRVELLCAVAAEDAKFSVAASGGGLFVEMAAECRAAYGNDAAFTFLCGRDAAERIVNWDYGRPGAVGEMLRQFDLLVAARGGRYEPPPEFRAAIRSMELAGEFDHVSATEVRATMARGETWEHLVPAAIRERVKKIYGGKGPDAGGRGPGLQHPA
jgi:nicotinate-nucleotide adenylyltransferase